MKNNNFISCEVEEMFNNDPINVLDTIIGCMYCGIVMAKTGQDGFVVWNEQAKEILGKPQKEIPIEEWADYYGVYNPITLNLLTVNEIPLVKGLAGIITIDQEIFVKNEFKETWINCTSKPIIKNKEIIGAVVVFQDIAKAKKMQLELEGLLINLEKLKTTKHEIVKQLPLPDHHV